MELWFDSPVDVTSTCSEHASFINELSVGYVCRYPQNLSGSGFGDFPSVGCYADVERAFSGKRYSVFGKGFTRNLSSQDRSPLRSRLDYVVSAML